jgi:hypothetical protein
LTPVRAPADSQTPDCSPPVRAPADLGSVRAPADSGSVRAPADSGSVRAPADSLAPGSAQTQADSLALR